MHLTPDDEHKERAVHDLDLTEEQRMLKDAVRKFCLREAPRDRLRELTNNGETAHVDSLFRKMAQLGWLGICIPEVHGGVGGSLLDLLVLVDELSYGRAPVGGHFTNSILLHAVKEFGTETQRAEVLSALSDGAVLSIAITEPDAGSDVASLQTRATPRADGGGWLLNGQKMFTTNVNIARWVIVVARVPTDEPDRRAGLTLFLVPTDRAGITHNRVPTLGHVDTNVCYLDDVEVSPADVLGEVGEGFKHLLTMLNAERLVIGAYSVGLARRALDDTITYVQERQQFGKAIGKFQAVQHTIAEMATKVYAAESLVLRVGRKMDARCMSGKDASIVKLFTTETAKAVALDGMQMMGGYGYMMEYEMQHYLRDALVGTVFGGTSQIQKNIIAQQLGL